MGCAVSRRNQLPQNMDSKVAARMTLEEFLAQPGATYHDFHELWDGEVVEVSPPSEQYVWFQDQLVDSLAARLPKSEFLVRSEFYLTLPGEARWIDVGAVRRSRMGHSKQPFFGSPELVVEVLSESNTALDLDRLRAKCFENGCIQFWVVNLELRTITVYEQERRVRIYSENETLSVAPLRAGSECDPTGDDLITVRSLFDSN